MKKLLCLVCLAVLITGCELAKPVYMDLWFGPYDSEHTYNKGDTCLLGEEDGEEIIWESVQDNNCGNRPFHLELDEIVLNSEWWTKVN